jgi:DNA-binding FadR family transcriptional regulator
MQNASDTLRIESVATLVGRSSARNLRDQIAWELGVDIVAGRYPADSVLHLDTEIVDRFNVSRTVLREAVNALAAKGMLEARARTGTKVLPRQKWNMFDADVLVWHFEAGPDVDFLSSLREIRIAVELQAVALAASRRSDEHVANLLICADRMAHATTTEEFALADLEFHSTIADASENPFMASISSLVKVALAAAFTISSPVSAPQSMAEVVQSHRRIAEAIRDKFPARARRAMQEVIWSGFNRAAGRASQSPARSQAG